MNPVPVALLMLLAHPKENHVPVYAVSFLFILYIYNFVFWCTLVQILKTLWTFLYDHSDKHILKATCVFSLNLPFIFPGAPLFVNSLHQSVFVNNLHLETA